MWGASAAYLFGAFTWGELLHWIGDKLLAPALVAVVFSGLTNLVIERLKAKRDQATKLCDTLRVDVTMLQQMAGEYWGRAGKTDDAIIEAKMLALQTEIIGTVTLLRSDFRLDLGDDLALALLADQVTGGAFGTWKRKADPDRLKGAFSRLGDLRLRITQERWRRMKLTGW